MHSEGGLILFAPDDVSGSAFPGKDAESPVDAAAVGITWNAELLLGGEATAVSDHLSHGVIWEAATTPISANVAARATCILKG